MKIQKKSRIVADEEVMVAPEATELVFEAEDVAEIVAEFTGEDVEVEVVEDGVEFTVGEDSITVEPEGDEELLEASTKVLGKKAVKASSSMQKRAVRRRAR